MRSHHGYKLPAIVTKQRRPLGVAILATLGVLVSLAAIMVSLVQLLMLMRAGGQPDLQMATAGAALVLALIVLWINWGFWELIHWAWWANLLLTLITGGALIATLRFLQPLASALAKMRPDLAAGQITSGVLTAIIALLALQLIIALYMLSVRAAFGVGVKDERPLWERAQRR
jgi:hypothetical protein